MSGRPTVITPKVVSLLLASFHNGLTVREACWQSGISHETYYSRVRSDKQFADKMAKAQADLTMTAKLVIAKQVREGNISAAKWWVERQQTKMDESQPQPEPAMSDEEAERNMRLLYESWEHKYELQKRREARYGKQ